MEPSVYDAVGGSAGLLRLADAWHRRCLEDPVVSHAFSHPGQHPQHVERLATYWAEALGGPAAYTGELGDHSYVLRLHAGNGVHEEMDQRAQRCFAAALDDAAVSADPKLRSTLTDWFEWMTDAMAAHPRSPDDVAQALALPIWSWDGPIEAERG
jgi:hemoglobin